VYIHTDKQNIMNIKHDKGTTILVTPKITQKLTISSSQCSF